MEDRPFLREISPSIEDLKPYQATTAPPTYELTIEQHERMDIRHECTKVASEIEGFAWQDAKSSTKSAFSRANHSKRSRGCGQAHAPTHTRTHPAHAGHRNSAPASSVPVASSAPPARCEPYSR